MFILSTETNGKPWYIKSHLPTEKICLHYVYLYSPKSINLNVNGRGTKVFFPKIEVKEAWKRDPLTMSSQVPMPWCTPLEHGNTRSSSALLPLPSLWVHGSALLGNCSNKSEEPYLYLVMEASRGPHLTLSNTVPSYLEERFFVWLRLCSSLCSHRNITPFPV